MAKKKDPTPPTEGVLEKKVEMVPVLLGNGCISHWVEKKED